MSFRVPGGPKLSRQNWGVNVFTPTRNLPGRILNYSVIGRRPNLIFRSDGIAFEDQGTLPGTQQLSRLIFQNSSIRSLAFKENLKPSDQIEARLDKFFQDGDFLPIRDLCREVEIMPPVTQMVAQGAPLVDLPVSLETIPGTHKHYTDYAGYQTILNEQTIRARSYQERVAKVCLTRDSLSPAQALDRLFIGNPDYDGRGDFVFGFDLHPGLKLATVANTKANEEWFLSGDLSFGIKASLRFAGANPLA